MTPPRSARRPQSCAAKAQATAQGGAATAAAAPSPDEASGVRVLKKYPNRRLYDTASSSYITLAEVKGLVMRAEPFVVRDAKTGEDLTRSILLQIILEEEAGGSPLLSEAVLCQLIRFYGHAMQGFFGAQLAAQIQAFAEMQQHMMAAAPAVGAEAWPQHFSNWPPNSPNLPNWPELMSHYAPTSQTWQQAQAQMQRQLQAGLQSWMAAFQPPPTPPAPEQAQAQASKPRAKAAAKPAPQPSSKTSSKRQPPQ